MVQNYMSKFVTPEVAAKAVRSGDWVDYGFGRLALPELMDGACGEKRGAERRQDPGRPGDPPPH